MTQPQPAAQAQPRGVDRRGFLKMLAWGAAGIGALALLRKRPFGGFQRQRRSIPADLPGDGSIFQPRNDRRRQ